MAKFTLVVGTKTYSSWSLRAWLAARVALGPDGFEEVKVLLGGAHALPERRAEAAERLRELSPSGKVPVLIDRSLQAPASAGEVINESLAIAIHLALQFPESRLFPASPQARAACLAASAEMHSGFSALRNYLPHNCRAMGRTHGASALSRDDVKADISRLIVLWSTLRERFGEGGPYLFGDSFSIADCMYAPVANRFACYDPELVSLDSSVAKEYVLALLAHPLMLEWKADAALEGPEWSIDSYDAYVDPTTV